MVGSPPRADEVGDPIVQGAPTNCGHMTAVGTFPRGARHNE